MSGLKSIEMQVALPRTQEFGRMQEQQNQKTIINQHLQLEEAKEKQALDRKRTERAQSTEKGNLFTDERDAHSEHQEKEKHRKQKKEQKKMSEQHPYKGKHIDLSL